MTELTINRIILARAEVHPTVMKTIDSYWRNVSDLVMDSDGENYIVMKVNKMYRLDSNIQGIDSINSAIENYIRIPRLREKKLNTILDV